MPALTWLADALRGAGLTVHEVSGWRTRGRPTYRGGAYAGPDMDMRPAGVLCHATAGSRTSTSAGEINVLLHGSASAPPPIAQLFLGRDGHWTVIAAGVCNHAGSGGLWNVSGNSRVIGVEAANDNRGEAWPAVQLDSYARGVAALLRRLGLGADRAGAHREWNPGGKTDPVGIDMTVFRARVAALIADPKEDDVTPQELLKTSLPVPGYEWLSVGNALAELYARSAPRGQLTATLVELRELRAIVGELAITAGVDPDVLTERVRDAVAAAVTPGMVENIAEQVAARLEQTEQGADRDAVVAAVREVFADAGQPDAPAPA